MRHYDIWVDGACSGNQFKGAQPMGGGIVAHCDGHEREWPVPLGYGTNQLAEIQIVGEALERIKDRANADVVVNSDSAYAIGVLTKPWKPKANLEAIAKVKSLIKECGSFQMVKVSGHSGHAENERADRLAVAAVSEVRKT
jgi:ribonuclease HI